MAIKLLSWNVNGLRAAVKKGFCEAVAQLDPDILGLQEIKLSEGQLDLKLHAKYFAYWNYAAKKGYSGTALFSKEEPIAIVNGIPIDAMHRCRGDLRSPAEDNSSLPGEQSSPLHVMNSRLEDIEMSVKQMNSEGRLITAEFPHYYVLTCYTPNSKDELARLRDRLLWGQCFTEYVRQLQLKKPVLICGDLNVAHRNIDLKNDKTNHKNAGFSNEERADFANLLAKAKLIDTFRYLYPVLDDAYSWWSFRGNARANNAGWRIDYWLASRSLANSIVDSVIYPEITGSDHCPVELKLK